MTCPPHPAERVELRKKPGVSGPVYVHQCQDCGKKVGPSIKPEKLSDPRSVPFWNARLAKRPQPNSGTRELQRFYQSPEWRRLSRRVLERDNWTCRTCGEVANQAGHLHYDHPLGEERMEDLIAQCGECNQAEKQQRITGHVLGPTRKGRASLG